MEVVEKDTHPHQAFRHDAMQTQPRYLFVCACVLMCECMCAICGVCLCVSVYVCVCVEEREERLNKSLSTFGCALMPLLSIL